MKSASNLLHCNGIIRLTLADGVVHRRGVHRYLRQRHRPLQRLHRWPDVPRGAVRCVHCADAAPTDGLLGSNVYEVNQWLWQFGRGKPRLGGLTIKETSERKDAVSNAQHKRAAETVRHS